MAGDKHGIRSIKGPHKKIHVRADCEKCHHKETISVYENDIEYQEFKLRFFGCVECQKIFCLKCAGDDDGPECPFCKKLKPKDIKPFDIYVMAVFFEKWLGDKSPVQEWEETWRI